jgi:hypothetical protein
MQKPSSENAESYKNRKPKRSNLVPLKQIPETSSKPKGRTRKNIDKLR